MIRYVVMVSMFYDIIISINDGLKYKLLFISILKVFEMHYKWRCD